MHFPLYALVGESFIDPGLQLEFSLMVYLGMFFLVWYGSIDMGSKRAALVNFAALPAYIGLPLIFSGLAVLVPISIMLLAVGIYGLKLLVGKTAELFRRQKE